jgi:hypothetical protein
MIGPKYTVQAYNVWMNSVSQNHNFPGQVAVLSLCRAETALCNGFHRDKLFGVLVVTGEMHMSESTMTKCFQDPIVTHYFVWL